jgi:hypothetical protein
LLPNGRSAGTFWLRSFFNGLKPIATEWSFRWNFLVVFIFQRVKTRCYSCIVPKKFFDLSVVVLTNHRHLTVYNTRMVLYKKSEFNIELAFENVW